MQAKYVSDLYGARNLFVKYLRAKAGNEYHNERRDFRSFFLCFDDGARPEIMTRPALSRHEDKIFSLGCAHIAFSAGGKTAVDELTQRLQAYGCEVLSEPRATGDVYYESCVVGLEGNLVEITV